MGDGPTLPVLETRIGKIAAAICWENYMPALRMAMYSKDVSLWCAPTVDDRASGRSPMRHIAYEGRCFVLSSCQYLRRDDAPQTTTAFRGDAPNTELIKGGSVIINPLGEVLAAYIGQEVILSAAIDLDDVVRGKFDLDVTGHYARPDVFELKVDTRFRSAGDSTLSVSHRAMAMRHARLASGEIDTARPGDQQ